MNKSTEQKPIPLAIFLLIIGIIAGGVYYLFFFNTSTNTQDENTDLEKVVSVENGSEISSPETIPSDIDFEYLYSANDAWGVTEDEMMNDGLWVLGTLEEPNFNEYWSLSYDDVSIPLEFNSMEDESILSSGESFLVKGKFNDSGNRFVVNEYFLISNEYKEEFEMFRFPRAELEIVRTPSSISHACKAESLDVVITNIGEIPIRYTDFFGWMYGEENWSPKNIFWYVIDGEKISGFSWDEDTNSIGSLGFEDFGVIEVGESKTVQYGLGGYYFNGCDADGYNCGSGGTPHIFCSKFDEKEVGTHTLSLIMGALKSSSYSEGYETSRSNEVNIVIDSCECGE